MEQLVPALIALLLMVMVGGLAPLYGVDSRDGFALTTRR
jgi:hypothetical protein